MKFRIPIELKERRRYICVYAPVSKSDLSKTIERRLKELAGIKGCGIHRFTLLSLGDNLFLVKTAETSVAAVLTALLVSRYEDFPLLEVRGISGTLRRAKELCVVPSTVERRS